MNVGLLSWLFILHFIGDFILQSNWMALGKSKRFLPLMTHVLVYTCTFWIGTAVFGLSPAFALINGLIHFPVDFNTSRLNSKLYALEDKRMFFVFLGLDQLIHAITIIFSYPLLYWYFVV
jgi:hypothetical protein